MAPSRVATQTYSPQKVNTSRQEPNGPSGPPKGQDPFANGQAPYGMSPWYGGNAGVQMPWSGPPGQSVGQRAPQYTPNPDDPRNAGYFHQGFDSTPEWKTMHDASTAASNAARDQSMANNPAFQTAMQNHDAQGAWNAQRAGAQDLNNQQWAARGMQSPAQIWAATGGQGGITPRSVSGNYQYGPGRPGPTPPGVSQGTAAPQGGGQYGNSMITGYQPSASPQASTGGHGVSDLMVHPGDPGWAQQQQRFGGASTGGAQSTLAADAQRTGPGFNPPPGSTRGTTGPTPPPTNPQDPRQFPGGQPPSFNPNPGGYGYSPFQGSQWGGQVGYDMGGMQQAFGQMSNGMNGGQMGGLQDQLMQANQMRGNSQMYGGGGYGSNMAQPQNFGGYGGQMQSALGNMSQGLGMGGGGPQQFNPQMMQALQGAMGGGFGGGGYGGYAPQQQMQMGLNPNYGFGGYG